MDKTSAASMEIEVPITKKQTSNMKIIKTFKLNGEILTEDELKHVIKSSESQGTTFNLGRFLLIAFYHLLLFLTTPIIAVPIIFVLEGFDAHLIYNMRFVGLSMPFFLQTMVSMGIVSSYIFYYQWYKNCYD